MHPSWHINNFDLIRILAALQVFIVHCVAHLHVDQNNLLIKVISCFPGVPIFFIVSGFLVSASYEKSDSIKNYYFNRFLRIYPGLWVCLIISCLSVLAIGGISWPYRETLQWLLAQATILQVYHPDFLRSYGCSALNGSLWTIAVEIQFYLTVPILYKILNQYTKSNAILVILIALCSIINLTYTSFSATEATIMQYKIFGVTLLPYYFMFLIGVFYQKNYQKIINFIAGKALHCLILYLSCTYILHLTGAVVTGNTINPLSVILLSITVFACAYTKPNLSYTILKGNDISYGTYIYHMIFINMAIELGISIHWYSMPITLLMTLLTAYASWKSIEQPMLKLKHYSIKTSLSPRPSHHHMG